MEFKTNSPVNPTDISIPIIDASSELKEFIAKSPAEIDASILTNDDQESEELSVVVDDMETEPVIFPKISDQDIKMDPEQPSRNRFTQNEFFSDKSKSFSEANSHKIANLTPSCGFVNQSVYNNQNILEQFIGNWAVFHQMLHNKQSAPQVPPNNIRSAEVLASLIQATNLEMERSRQVAKLQQMSPRLSGALLQASALGGINPGMMQLQPQNMPFPQKTMSFPTFNQQGFQFNSAFMPMQTPGLPMMHKLATHGKLLPHGYLNPVINAAPFQTTQLFSTTSGQQVSPNKHLNQVRGLNSKIIKSTAKEQLFPQSLTKSTISKLNSRTANASLDQKQNGRLAASCNNFKTPLRTSKGNCGATRLLKEMDNSMMSGVSVVQMTENLTANHLRKAKLMFFYQRYPNSAILRQFFVDVKFNRSNNAQLIKWFSNFREYYYIQIEKFVRDTLQKHKNKFLSNENRTHSSYSSASDLTNQNKEFSGFSPKRANQNRPFDIESLIGDHEVTNSEEQFEELRQALTIDKKSDLFKNLNTHYNKTSNFEVPDEFMNTVNVTIQHFAVAVSSGKDRNSGWKKQIYKVISKLDTNIPHSFRAALGSQLPAQK